MFRISMKNWKIVDNDEKDDDDDDRIHVNAIDTAGPSDQCGV